MDIMMVGREAFLFYAGRWVGGCLMSFLVSVRRLYSNYVNINIKRCRL